MCLMSLLEPDVLQIADEARRAIVSGRKALHVDVEGDEALAVALEKRYDALLQAQRQAVAVAREAEALAKSSGPEARELVELREEAQKVRMEVSEAEKLAKRRSGRLLVARKQLSELSKAVEQERDLKRKERSGELV